MFVVTADQRGSRAGPDRVDDLLGRLHDRAAWPPPVRPFERTTGDEVQGVLADAPVVIDLALALVRDGHWSVGIGVGSVREPLPASTRAGAGEAFTNARAAVERAKSDPQRVAVVGPEGSRATDAEAILRLLAALAQRRTEAGWEAIDLVARGATQREAAGRLGVSKQAISQRLHAALWPQERHARPVAATLLKEADDR